MRDEFRHYANEPGFPPLIIYDRQHKEATVAGTRAMIKRYEAAFSNGYVIDTEKDPTQINKQKLAHKGAVIPMEMGEIFQLQRYIFDATDPDNFWDPQDLHALQVGLAGGDPKNLEMKMLSLFGYIHDISKAVFGIDMADQMVVGGDIYPLGICPRQVIGRGGKDMIPYWDQGFSANSDWENDLYPKNPSHPEYNQGIYAPLVLNGTMGLDQLDMLLQHDRHLRIIFDHMPPENHRVPETWMKLFKFLAAYHSFHALHDFDSPEAVRNGPFYWAANDEERAILAEGIPEKHARRDLYTKSKIQDKDSFRTQHYPRALEMLNFYFPEPILVPILTDRLPRFLRLMKTESLDEVLQLISPAARFDKRGGVTLAPYETGKPFQGELINGTLELLRVRAFEEHNPDFVRIVQEIICALRSPGNFYGIGVPAEDLVRNFNPSSPRSNL